MVLARVTDKGTRIKLIANVYRPAWDAIAEPLKHYLHRRMSDVGMKNRPRWKIGDNLIERTLGYEITPLLVAIEDASPDEAKIAFDRWMRLHRAERLNFARYIEADAESRSGWWAAIKIALCNRT